jgi:hypothetical protein
MAGKPSTARPPGLADGITGFSAIGPGATPADATSAKGGLPVDFAERAARNEETFRTINDRIDEGAQQHAVDAPLPFHCECDNAACVDKINIRPSEYERVVVHRYRFVLIPGHEDTAVERIVERHDDYVIAEKIGEAREQIERDHPQERHRR